MGVDNFDQSHSKSFCNLTINSDVQEQLEKFWRIEECSPLKLYSTEENEVEKHFVENTTQSETGQFIVKLPLRDNYTELGNSYDMALKRFYPLHRRLNKDNELKNLYTDFMTEYAELEHMVPMIEEPSDKVCYYMPHHGVLKASSLTTKLRTVFDASTPSSSGLSLNDVLKVGPVIQDDLFSILARFRKHNYVITGDVAKMFRCVLLHESQRNLQRIIWRANPSDPIQIFKLNTVTYGQACSSFLAIRCLYQVGLDNEEKFPEASRSIKRDFYCDDLLTGSDTIDSCIRLRKQISDLLGSAHFSLRKWSSNDKTILQDLRESNETCQFIITDDHETKTLGILWDTSQDVLGFTVNFEIPNLSIITKRTILSIISKLFDPLGLAGPALIQAKIMLQNIWKLNLSWDDTVPIEIQKYFKIFCQELKLLADIKIPRQAVLKNHIDLEVHGFCDSSEQAYGACVYLRSVDSAGNPSVTLLCAKARVAPLKTQTLPRLELLGSVVLSKLVQKTVTALEIEVSNIYYLTDSTIVLDWLNSEPSILKCFVANRVVEVQRLTDITQWRHVRSEHNPADVISRGASSSALLDNQMWWHGPQWLTLSSKNWPVSDFSKRNLTELPEVKNVEKQSLLINFDTFDLFEKFSSLSKLQRFFAYVLRFISNCKIPRARQTERQGGFLTNTEYENSLNKLTFIAQTQMFLKDIDCLRKNKELPSDSRILSLNPFLDNFGLLRVGGRIKNSEISYDKRFPLLIKDKHPFSLLIIRYAHIRYFHAGCQATLAAIRFRFWLINGRNAVRYYIRNCIICCKANPIANVITQMANLPSVRVRPARPFLKSGVDFAGPFLIKNSQLRNRQLIKAYLCVFICLVTRAVHFEVCTDLSSQTFLAALKRFVSRRGICQSLISDNGTNFVGARNELREAYQSLRELHRNNAIMDFLRENNIEWNLIPPRSPHFGGMWESAVKSAKHHLKRIAGNAHLTFEMFYTLVVEVESILNSRPLTPISSDANDLQFLTPAHFLIGDTLRTPPEPDYIEIPLNRLSHYNQVQKMFQEFWIRWKNEYLSNLQQRTKWQFSNKQSVLPGAMVIIKEDNVVPLQWPMGRILKTYPGDDNNIRVVDIKTKTGIVRRPVAKLCILPIEDTRPNLQQ